MDAPELVLGGFRMKFTGRDGDLVHVEVRCQTEWASAGCAGDIAVDALKRLRRDLSRMHGSLEGGTRFGAWGCELEVEIRCSETGRVDLDVKLSPDGHTERHWFRLCTDQTELPATAEAIRRAERMPTGP